MHFSGAPNAQTGLPNRLKGLGTLVLRRNRTPVWFPAAGRKSLQFGGKAFRWGDVPLRCGGEGQKVGAGPYAGVELMFLHRNSETGGSTLLRKFPGWPDGAGAHSSPRPTNSYMSCRASGKSRGRSIPGALSFRSARPGARTACGPNRGHQSNRI